MNLFRASPYRVILRVADMRFGLHTHLHNLCKLVSVWLRQMVYLNRRVLHTWKGLSERHSIPTHHWPKTTPEHESAEKEQPPPGSSEEIRQYGENIAICGIKVAMAT